MWDGSIDAISQKGVCRALCVGPADKWHCGLVRDTSGAVLPGFTVEATSPALIEKVRAVATAGQGRYNIVDLRPGTYVVTRDPAGALWLAGPGALWHRQADGFVPVGLPAAAGDGDVQSMVAGRDGTLWVGIVRAGLFRLADGRWTQERRFAESATIPLVATPGVADETWFGYPNATVVRVHGRGADTFTRHAGVPAGDVTAIFGRRDHVWIGGPEGLAVFDGARFRAVITRDGGLRGISGIVETADREPWVSGGFGVARIAASEVTRALADPQYEVREQRFDYSDGLSGVPQQFRPLPSAVESRDGRLWFSTIDSVVWVDPKRLPVNPLAPPVVIRSVTGEHAPVQRP